MTNKNTRWTNQPFLLQPVGKDYLWGGNRLNRDFSKQIDMTPLAETWECSTHPDGLSLVSGGVFHGRTLKSVLEEHPEYLGNAALPNGQLPVLIKLIDAKEDLSVQVHPNDEYAYEHEQGSLGKYEMWYVLDADSDSYLVYGFNRDIDRETLQKSLQDNTLEKYLQYVPIKKDDIFFVEPGRVHAIGAGALIAEIQENSNLTYRLYDYNRKDKNGQPRALHIDKALDAIDFKNNKEPRQPMRVLRYQQGCASELLCRCKYFQAERLLINTKTRRQIAFCSPSEQSFQILLCIDGKGTLFPEGGSPITLHKGDCVFIPAKCTQLEFDGNLQILKVGC